MLAFNRESQWRGKFQELVDSHPEGERNRSQKARYSFINGGYVEDFDLHENGEECDGTLALANAMQKALQLRDKDPSRLVKGMAKSGAEFSVTQSYHGLVFWSFRPRIVHRRHMQLVGVEGHLGTEMRIVGKGSMDRTKLDEEMLKKGLKSNSFNNLGPEHTF